MTMPPSVLVIVHQATSSPGLVGEKLQSLGFALDIRCPAIGDALPPHLNNHAGVVVFGGPMSANDDDTLPFIRQELDWVEQVLTVGKPYLGICLGAQLLARVLGAKVQPHPENLREIGYFPLHPTATGQPYFTDPLCVYHWHQEGFTLPAGTRQLAAGDRFPHQAFEYQGSAFGLQFHPEITRDLITEWTEKGADQLHLPGAQPRDLHFHYHNVYGKQVEHWLDRFLRNVFFLA